MKKLFIFIAAVIILGLTACEDEKGNAQEIIVKDEFERSSIYSWSYLRKNRNEVENELIKAGWIQNYAGQTYSGSPVVLYIYNRPTDQTWKPKYFTKYAYDTQRNDNTSLNTLMLSGKMYGELYMIFKNEVVQDLGVFWMLPTTNAVLDRYISFSNCIYQAYTADCGADAQWTGRVANVTYDNRQSYISNLQNTITPAPYESALDARTEVRYSYRLEARYNYYLNSTFYIAYEGEKY